jgi:hypothetical protein
VATFLAHHSLGVFGVERVTEEKQILMPQIDPMLPFHSLLTLNLEKRKQSQFCMDE